MSFVPTLTLSGWDYSDVVDRMDALGFLLLSESTEPPLLAGEPELAQFTHRREQAEVTMTFDPVRSLRHFDVHGEDAEQGRRILMTGLPLDAAVPEALTQAILEALPRVTMWDALDTLSRRQLLRWMIREGLATERVEQTAARALQDDDWEVRTTAMILVARLGLTSLGLAVRRCPPPRARLGPEERSVVRAIQQATVQSLNGQRPEEGPQALLHAALEGRGEGALADYVRAFTEPLEHTEGDERDAKGLMLYPVPSVRHRVGPLDLRSGAGLQDHTPEPFWLTQGPLTRSQAGLMTRRNELWRGTLQEARTLCGELGMVLPTALQWECGLRGPDGRTRPWGMGGKGPGRSPWGPYASEGPEWVREGGAMELDWRLHDVSTAMLRPAIEDDHRPT